VLLASDSSYNGRFFAGVLTTGIYCLPSCKARKPKPGNVHFFSSVEAARSAGLRPCRKCHPDDFARGADPVLESIETLAAEIRSAPPAFPDVSAVVRRSGFGATRLFELFRLHYHVTPADLLLRARLSFVKSRLLSTSEPLASLAHDAGFEALSSLHENFRRLNGVTPMAYREMRNTHHCELALPPGYAVPYLRRALSRDFQSLTERFSDDLYTAGVNLPSGPDAFTMKISDAVVQAELKRGSGVEAHGIAVKLLGLEQDAAGFARLAQRLGLARLICGRAEMRISQTQTVWDGLLWSLIGQQINFAFACLLRRRLVEKAGTRLSNGLYAVPTAGQVAALSADDLLALQFSRQKAEYVLGLARLVADNKLDPEALRDCSASRVERMLLAVRGLGPWSVHYVMMRALGFEDCVPLGDTGVASGLQALLQLEERPDLEAVRRLMSVFSPYRSLATAQLWQFNKPIPV